MDDYTVQLDPETEMYCTLHLFTNVGNSNEVYKKIISGKLHCAAVKPAIIVDAFHAIVAANKAALNAKSNQLTTKTLYTEVLFSLSPTKKISHSLLQFGINNEEKNILVVSIHKLNDQKSISQAINDAIKGDKIPISRLSEFTDVELVQNTYSIKEVELNISNLSDSVVSRVSCKDFWYL